MKYRRRAIAMAGTVATVATAVIALLPTPRATADSCPTVALIGARGSGQAATDSGGFGPQVASVSAAFSAKARAAGWSVDQNPVKYDAVNVVSAWVVAQPGIYDASVALGRENVIGQVGRYYWDCQGRTRVVLAGYSQGAQVVGDALEKMFANYPRYASIVDGMAMLGDPAFKGSASYYNSGNFDATLNGVFASVRGRARSLTWNQGQRVPATALRTTPSATGVGSS